MPTEAESKQPRFFLSYARGASDAYLDRFYQDLRKEVAFREGLDNSPKNKEVGFRDTDDIPGGADWPNELASVLRGAWACVSLYTPLYFKREYCGKEFQVFLDRANAVYDADGAAENARCILPVLWASMRDLQRHQLPPEVAKRINFSAKKHQQRYEQEGLRHILRRSPKSAYIDILSDIVDDLLERFAEHPDPLPETPSLKKINNAFMRPALAAADQAGEPLDEAVKGGRMAVLLITPQNSSSAFGAKGADEWLTALEDEDENLSVSIEYALPAAAQANTIVDKLSTYSLQNRLLFVVVDPAARAEHEQDVESLLQSITTSEGWTGALLIPQAPIPAGDNSLANRLKLPEATAGRILLREVAADPKSFAADLKRIRLELLKLIVSESSVQRRPPGGGTPKERPKIRGPVETRGND